jgi:uncharacterized membrane protein YdjX (TVP38/TMEM64 family)
MISGKVKLGILTILLIAGIVAFTYRDAILDSLIRFYHFSTDREAIKIFLESYGRLAPPLFICIQVLQVLFAPIPGEATGFIGGYLFGVVPGFTYSTIGLTLGSWINFSLGRVLGRRYGKRIIPPRYIERFDTIVKHQGVVISFILFILPGFPKDYLSIFLGFSSLSTKVFLLIAGIGRIPGTFMLSLQGAHVYQQNYGTFVILFLIAVSFTLPVIYYRKQIYRWIENLDKK